MYKLLLLINIIIWEWFFSLVIQEASSDYDYHFIQAQMEELTR